MGLQPLHLCLLCRLCGLLRSARGSASADREAGGETESELPVRVPPHPLWRTWRMELANPPGVIRQLRLAATGGRNHRMARPLPYPRDGIPQGQRHGGTHQLLQRAGKSAAAPHALGTQWRACSRSRLYRIARAAGNRIRGRKSRQHVHGADGRQSAEIKHCALCV